MLQDGQGDPGVQLGITARSTLAGPSCVCVWAVFAGRTPEVTSTQAGYPGKRQKTWDGHNGLRIGGALPDC